MSLLVNNTNGLSSPYYALVGIAGGVNLQSNCTLTMRARFNTLSSNDEFGVFWTASASNAGAYIGRQAGETAGRWSTYRSNSLGTTVNECLTTGYVADGTWRHFALTYDGTNMRSYIDGVLQTTVASTASLVTSTTATNIGLAVGGRYVMCDVMLFSRALSAQELQKLALQRSVIGVARGSDLFAWYPQLAGDFAQDYSGLNNDVTLQAGTGTAPAADGEDPGVTWGARRNRIVVPPAAVTLQIAGAGASITNAAGALAAAKEILGAGATITNANGLLVATKPLAGAGAAVTNAAGLLSKAAPLAGVGATTTDSSGSLNAVKPVVAAGATVTNATGLLGANLPVVGAGRSVTDASAALSAGATIAGSADTATNASGALEAAGALAGAGATVTDGSLTPDTPTLPVVGSGDTVTAGAGALSSAAAAIAVGATLTSGAAALQAASTVQGSGATVSAGVGALAADKPLVGSSATRTDASGQLGKLLQIAGSGATVTSGSAQLTAAKLLVGTALTRTDSAAILTALAALVGAGDTVTSGVGTISGGTPVVADVVARSPAQRRHPSTMRRPLRW